MSSFSSVVRKSGASFRPKTTPRRNVPRRSENAISALRSSSPNAPPASNDEATSERDLLNEDTAPTPAPDIAPLRNTLSPVHDTDQREPSHSSTLNTSLDIRTNETSDPRRITSIKARVTRQPSNQEIRVESELHPVASYQPPAADAEPVFKRKPDDFNSIEPSSDVLEPTFDVDIVNRRAVSEDVNQNTSSLRKRRRITPRATAVAVRSPTRTPASSPASAVAAGSLLSRQSSQSQPPSDLIQSATQRAASVSNLANSIEAQTRASSIRRSGPENPSGLSELSGKDYSSSPIPTRKARKRKEKTASEQAAEVIANAVGNTTNESYRRETTPEGAEDYEIEPNEVTMGELTRDRKLGKKSQLEADMQRDWADIVKRRKEARDMALENAQKGRKKTFGGVVDIPLQATVAIGPRTEIRNGKIVVVEESRQIDRGGVLEQAAVLDAENVREDKFYYKRVNQNTVGMKPNASRRFRWDEDSTDLFFRGLQMFGTDFMMISNMFPGLDRKQVKMKFIREENADKAKVMKALADRLPVDLEEYAKVTDTNIQDPADVDADIVADEKRLRDEDQQRRIREGFINVDSADQPIATTEVDDVTLNENAVEGESRFASIAEEIMIPKRRQRKAGSTLLRKRGPKTGRQPVEGVEEVLGSIDEVQV